MTTTAPEQNQDEFPELPEDELTQLPEYIFDSFRRMLWQLEADGLYGLAASADPIGYIRRSIDDLKAALGQYVPLAADRRGRDEAWRLTT